MCYRNCKRVVAEVIAVIIPRDGEHDERLVVDVGRVRAVDEERLQLRDLVAGLGEAQVVEHAGSADGEVDAVLDRRARARLVHFVRAGLQAHVVGCRPGPKHMLRMLAPFIWD